LKREAGLSEKLVEVISWFKREAGLSEKLEGGKLEVDRKCK
jgi:hypothetical protein